MPVLPAKQYSHYDQNWVVCDVNEFQDQWIGLVAVTGDVDQRRQVVYDELLRYETRSFCCLIIMLVFSSIVWGVVFGTRDMFLTKPLLPRLSACSFVYLRQKRRYMFLPMFVCLSVCLSVSKITQKRMHGFWWNVVCPQMWDGKMSVSFRAE